MKYINCYYCDKRLRVSIYTSHKAKCERCHRVWHNMRSKYREYGAGVTVDALVVWYLNQKQKCVECGTRKRITVDRIIPASQGGKYELRNMQLLCYTCNCCKKWKYRSVKEAMVPPTKRECIKCNKVKLLDKFYLKGYTSRYRRILLSAYHNICKICTNINRKDYYIKNHARIRARRSEIKHNNRA